MAKGKTPGGISAAKRDALLAVLDRLAEPASVGNCLAAGLKLYWCESLGAFVTVPED